MTPARVAYADGPDGPLPDPAVIEAIIGRPVSVLLGWVVRTPDWLATTPAPLLSVMLGAGLRGAARSGRVQVVASRLSAVPAQLAGRWRPDVTVVGAVEAGAGRSGWRLVGGPGWALAAVRASAAAGGGVVIERWPADEAAGRARGPELPGTTVPDVIDRVEPADPPPDGRRSPAHDQVGRLVAGLVPDGATIQWGPGGVGAATVAALATLSTVERPVRVRSGLVTDELVGLAARGLLDGPAEAAYLWGGPDLHALVGDGRVALREVSYTHDLTAISATERFVAINTAIQVGLDGAANVEVAGGRVVSGPGGHPDFAAGASRSVGGLSIVALPSTSGGRSNVVLRPE
ncbi:MAG TPA: acetyl-CoA hydrolase/transferase C-terminal domain-containing protein, partial [Acidimicrobiales bacterium]|nr:acetyl-CoA hydrolase/transferase C-terminal domain-containing protein [Acidimicrobiales bacterium]